MVKFENAVYDPVSNSLKVDVKDSKVWIMNSMRRVLLSEIPCVGMFFDPEKVDGNDITVVSNTTSLHNEFLAHRISMIPLHFSQSEIDSYNKTAYTFVIDVKNERSSLMEVTSKDFKILNEEGIEMPESFTRRIFPPRKIKLRNDEEPEYILINKLKPGEHMHIRSSASVGTASQNSLWGNVSTASYSNAIDKDKADIKFQEIYENAIKTDSKVDKASLRKNFETLEAKRCFKTNSKGDPTEFNLTVECEAGQTPHDIIPAALSILSDKVRRYSKEFEGILQYDEEKGVWDAVYESEMHTLGNLVQSHLYERIYPDTLSYVGYYCPHPLENRFVLKLAGNDENGVSSAENISQAVKDSLEDLAKEIDEMSSAFKKR